MEKLSRTNRSVVVEDEAFYYILCDNGVVQLFLCQRDYKEYWNLCFHPFTSMTISHETGKPYKIF